MRNLWLMGVVCAATAWAEAPAKPVHGHLGVVMPMVTVASHAAPTTLASGVVMGVSSGLGLGIAAGFAFDAELVTLIDLAHGSVNIVVHPGLLYGLPLGFTVGARGAWETSGSYGFTPLINKGFAVGSNALFVEAAFPVRFKPTNDGVQPSATMVVHVGMGF